MAIVFIFNKDEFLGGGLRENTFATIPKEKQTRSAPAPILETPSWCRGGNRHPFRNFTGQSFGWPVSVLPETNFEFLYGTGPAKSGIKLPVGSVNRPWD